MKKKPLTLNLYDWEVRAILAGEMTQLRRSVTPQPPDGERLSVDEYRETLVDEDGELRPGRILFGVSSEDGEYAVPSPLGKPGDEIVCKEAWGVVNYLYGMEGPCLGMGEFVYWADCPPYRPMRYRPAQQMQVKHSRIRIVNRGIRVERLGEMTEADAIKSGCGSPITRDCKLPNFIARWMEDERRGKWEPDRLVWVMDFERKKPA